MSAYYRRIVARWLFRSSLATYAVSFFLPTFVITVAGKPGKPDSGFTAFAVCPLMAFHFHEPLPFFAWLANPALWAAAGLTLTGRILGARLAAVAATLAACLFLGGEGLRAGYYAWLASMVLMLAAAFALPLAAEPREFDSRPPSVT